MTQPTTRPDSRRRFWTLAVMVLATVAAILATGTMSTSTAVFREKDGITVQDGFQAHPWAWAVIAALIITAGLVITAAIAYGRNHEATASKILIPAIVIGIVPTIVPGVLAGLARFLIIRQSSRPQ